MGKGQSKQDFLNLLACKDWKIVEKENPSAVTPLYYWIKQYGYDGRLYTDKIKQLQQGITDKCRGNQKKM